MMRWMTLTMHMRMLKIEDLFLPIGLILTTFMLGIHLTSLNFFSLLIFHVFINSSFASLFCHLELYLAVVYSWQTSMIFLCYLISQWLLEILVVSINTLYFIVLSLSDDDDFENESALEIQPYLMEETGLVEGGLMELTSEHQLGVKVCSYLVV